MAVFDKLMDQIDARMLLLFLCSVFVMTMLAAYLYVFKVPVGELKEVNVLVERSRIDRGRQKKSDVESFVKIAQDEVAALRVDLYGTGKGVDVNDIIPFIIGRLDELSEGTGVQLLSVMPGKTNDVLMFNEVAFEVNVSGDYLDLVKWLRAVDDELHPMVIKKFEMTSNQSAGKLMTRLKIVSYRLQDDQS